MGMIPEVKCRRCGETFSSLRSRCPNCGTRRVAQSTRTPGTTPGTVRGTASYERAETNTKWQMIFGLILVVAVILAVIVMVSTSLDGADNVPSKVTPPVAVTNQLPQIAGDFSVSQAYTIDEVVAAAAAGEAGKLLLPTDSMFAALPRCTAGAQDERRIKNGNEIKTPALADGDYRVYSDSGEFLMLGRAENGRMRTIKSCFEV